ncbi:hypothetical protein [Nocardia sp. NPDC057030]|uniref:hypothetical protein n=1 Tax=Nocardia sp. NPDC057030 TaxID=3346005 RepID=UPI00364453FE
MDDAEHAHRCHRGWLGFDAEYRPIPCLKCRPHLIKTVHSNTCIDPVPGAFSTQNVPEEP